MTTGIHLFRGVRYTTRELDASSGVPASIIFKRLKSGWSIDQAVCIPTVEQRRRGVVVNLWPSEGTGAGSIAQERPNIDFSDGGVSP